MRRHTWLWIIALGAALALPAGCGRPTLPGQQFRGQKAVTTSQKPITSPLPEKPIIEEGPANAKVRIVAFFPIDREHQPLIDLMKSLVKQYPGKVYIKYIDFRTPQGQEAFQNAKMTVQGLMINTEKEYTIQAKPHPYVVDFSQDMGRYWTADDLKQAVAQEVAAAYGEGGGATR